MRSFMGSAVCGRSAQQETPLWMIPLSAASLPEEEEKERQIGVRLVADTYNFQYKPSAGKSFGGIFGRRAGEIRSLRSWDWSPTRRGPQGPSQPQRRAGTENGTSRPLKNAGFR
jgi:hypothetical protein